MNLIRLRAVVALALSPLLFACPSASTMGLARTMPAGKLQTLVNPGAVTFAAATDAGSGAVTVPQLEFGVRYSVTDRVEVGAKAWFLGAAIDTKIGLLRPESEESGLNLALDPGISYIGAGGGTTGGGLLTVYLPVMLGYRFSHHELIVAPKLVGMVASGGGATGAVLFGGSSIGFAPRLAPGFRLMPEVSFLTPLAGAAAGGGESGSSSLLSATFIVQFGVGLLFGGD
jgi:hypothetical protein